MSWQTNYDYQEAECTTFTNRINELKDALGEKREITTKKDPEEVLQYLEELYEEVD